MADERGQELPEEESVTHIVRRGMKAKVCETAEIGELAELSPEIIGAMGDRYLRTWRETRMLRGLTKSPDISAGRCFPRTAEMPTCRKHFRSAFPKRKKGG